MLHSTGPNSRKSDGTARTLQCSLRYAEQFLGAIPAIRVGRKTALVALTVVGAEIAADVERVELGEAAPGLWLAAGR